MTKVCPECGSLRVAALASFDLLLCRTCGAQWPRDESATACPECHAACACVNGVWRCSYCGRQWPQGCGPEPYEEKRKRHQTADGAGRKR